MNKYLITGKAKPHGLPIQAVVEAEDRKMAKAKAVRALMNNVYWSSPKPVTKIVNVRFHRLHMHAKDVGMLE
jgi:hypothetical protein